MTLDDLEERLREIYRERVNKTLYIAGDGSLRYGEIIAVIDASKGAGVNRVGIITDGDARRASVSVTEAGRRRRAPALPMCTAAKSFAVEV